MTADLEKLLARLMTEREIEDLLARFDNAVLRYDRAAFRELWMEDGEWEISEPVPLQAHGTDAVVAALDQFQKVNEFFFRSTARPVIQLSGNRAHLRSPTIELARRDGKFGYANVAIYVDDLVLHQGSWKFARRFYQYLWVDVKAPLGGEIVSLERRNNSELATYTA